MVNDRSSFVAKETSVKHHDERNKKDDDWKNQWSTLVDGKTNHDEDGEENAAEEH